MSTDWISNKLESCSIGLNEEEKVWIFELDSFISLWKSFISYLSEEEIEKAKGYRNEFRKKLYILQKGITRKVIGDVLNIPPERLSILYDVKNKPYILGNDIYYSISHSSSYFMIGISKSRRVGVDIQKKSVISKELPTSIFSKQELQMYYCLDEITKRAFFLKAWALKEAITKATGDGMTVNFCDIDTMFLQKRKDENTIRFCYSNKVYLNAEIYVDTYTKYVCACVLLNEKGE